LRFLVVGLSKERWVGIGVFVVFDPLIAWEVELIGGKGHAAGGEVD
jgi:hypothetical protein